jgi:hypothetical protein
MLSAGGPVDETGITFAVYGEDLDPESVSSVLACVPTSSHRRGERRGPRSPTYKGGAWFLEVRGTAPQQPEALITSLLDQLPRDESVMVKLGELFEVQLRIALHLSEWNRDFCLSAELTERIARLKVQLVFDIYFDPE